MTLLFRHSQEGNIAMIFKWQELNKLVPIFPAAFVCFLFYCGCTCALLFSN